MSSEHLPELIYSKVGEVIESAEQIVPEELYSMAWNSENFDGIKFDPDFLRELGDNTKERRASAPLYLHHSIHARKQSHSTVGSASIDSHII